MIQSVVEDFDCVGCGACLEICSMHAITFKMNQEGFNYPFVDNQTCIQCSHCLNVCPAVNADKIKNPRGEVYAAASKDLSVLLDSSSGGMFSVIANYVLEHDGCVVGASFDSDMVLAHKVVYTSEDLKDLRGSKYLQSDIRATFKMIKEMLSQNKLVYFVGTSCQVAAIKLYVKNAKGNLFTSDIVCHGVPSQKIFNVFLNRLEKEEHVKVVRYKFRDKTVNGWSCSSSSSSVLRNKRIEELSYHKVMNAYFKGFISGSMNRECCYKCKYTTRERVSDITLADYWGVEKYHKDFHTDYGVSLVILNSERSKRIFEQVRGRIKAVKSAYEYAEEINKCLYESTPRPSLRDCIYDDIATNPNKIIDRFIQRGIDKSFIIFNVKKMLRLSPNLYKWLFKLKSNVKYKLYRQ